MLVVVKLRHSGKELSVEDLPPSDWPVGMSLHFLDCQLMEGGQPTVVGATPRQVGLNCVEKVAEQASKPYSSMVPSLVPALSTFPW